MGVTKSQAMRVIIWFYAMVNLRGEIALELMTMQPGPIDGLDARVFVTHSCSRLSI